MSELTLQALVVAVQAVNAEVTRILAPVAGDVTRLEPDDQEFLLSYTKAAMELKAMYIEAVKAVSNYPSYDELLEGRKKA